MGWKEPAHDKPRVMGENGAIASMAEVRYACIATTMRTIDFTTAGRTHGSCLYPSADALLPEGEASIPGRSS